LESAVESHKKGENKEAAAAAAAAGGGGGGGKDASVDVDDSLWEEASRKERFALPLFRELESRGLLEQWLSCSRSCFLLNDMSKVPSAKQAVLASLASLKSKINETTPGGKVLSETLRAVVTTTKVGGKKK